MSILGSIKRGLTRNIGLKLISLASAIMLFAFVRGAEYDQRSVFVDVVAQLPEDNAGQMLISEIPAKVKLTLRGSRSQLSRTDELDPVVINLRDTSLSYYYFEEGYFDVPVGVEIVDMAPSTIPLLWSEVGQRQLPIQVRLVGEAREGYALFGEATAEPEEVLVRGPTADVTAMTVVETDPIRLDIYEEGSHTEVVRLRRPPGHVRFVGRSSVRARFQVMAEVSERTFNGVELLQLGGEHRLRPPVVNVVVRGVPDQVDALSEAQVVPFVDASDFEPNSGAGTIDVDIQSLAAGLELVRIEPATVFITPAGRSLRRDREAAPTR